MKMHHRDMAFSLWIISWAIAIAGGVAFSAVENVGTDKGVYWALATVTTVGYGDITPHSFWGYIIADVTMVLAIPIWSLAVAFATSWVTSWHIWSQHDEMRQSLANPEHNIELGEDYWNRMKVLLREVR